MKFGKFVWKVPCCKTAIYRDMEEVMQMCSARKGVLRNFGKFKGKYPCQPAALLKKDSGTGIFL